MGFISGIFGYLLNYLYEFFNNYGIAIILFSVLLRLILIPITIKQQKTMKKSAAIQEKMNDLKKKYGNNPEKLNQETMELYKNEKMSPFSGCLSGILQILIILSVFWLVSQPLTYMKKIDKEIIDEYKTKITEENDGKSVRYPEIEIISRVEKENEEVNEKLTEENIENREELENKKEQIEKMRINMDFLGLDLSQIPKENMSDYRVWVIPVLYIISSFVSIKMTTNMQKDLTKKKEEKTDVIDVTDGKAEKVEQEETEVDVTMKTNKTMSWLMPIMAISIAIIAPLGLALYWLVNNILMIVERVALNKLLKSEEE